MHKPSIASEVGELPCQWEYLHFGCYSHLVMGVELAVPHKRHEHIGI